VVFSRKEALGLIDRIVYVTESWDTTTIRASVGQYIVTKYIAENYPEIRVLMVGEGPDEVCSSYLFNWFAPSGEALDRVARRMVSRIHLYDGKRADKCSAYWGLEVRVPFLDPEFISAYWGIPADQRHPRYKNVEKWWLRDAFKDLLPEEVAWRRKEAFSDGISSVEDSWHHILKRFYEEKKTDERGYLLGKFVDLFGAHNVPVLPGYWQPEFVENGGYVDPSARELNTIIDMS
jgi:asparagine synthase (glutamine-hydrolysing)